MAHTSKNKALVIVTIITLLISTTAMADPIQRNDALVAARTELPTFFAGPWQLTGEFRLHNLFGDTVAYTFMFVRAQPKSTGVAQEKNPAKFVKEKRAKLALEKAVVSGNESPLYGEEFFASIVISADDTEPVVLRCFRGLSPHLVKTSDAIALANERNRNGEWNVREYLMMGLFDEAFSVETSDGTPALVVDMRTRSIVTHAAAKEHALAKKQSAPDAEKIRMCKEAWSRYRQAEKTETILNK